MLRIWWADRDRNLVVRKKEEIYKTLKKKKLEYFGHIMRGSKYQELMIFSMTLLCLTTPGQLDRKYLDRTELSCAFFEEQCREACWAQVLFAECQNGITKSFNMKFKVELAENDLANSSTFFLQKIIIQASSAVREMLFACLARVRFERLPLRCAYFR